MRNHKQPWLAFLAVCSIGAALGAVPAQAAEKGWYVKAEPGVTYLTLNERGGGSESFVGARLSLAGGYNFNRWVGAELEATLIKGSSTKSGADSDDTWGQAPIMANVVFRYENDSKWVPYVGAGVGFDFLAEAVGSLFDRDAKTAGLCFQGMAGVRRELSRRAVLDIGYRFLTANMGSGWNNAQSHSLSLGFNWHF